MDAKRSVERSDGGRSPGSGDLGGKTVSVHRFLRWDSKTSGGEGGRNLRSSLGRVAIDTGGSV